LPSGCAGSRMRGDGRGHRHRRGKAADRNHVRGGATAEIGGYRHRALISAPPRSPEIRSPVRPGAPQRQIPYPASQPAVGPAPGTAARVDQTIPCIPTTWHSYRSRRFHGDGVDDLPAQAKHPSGDSCCHVSLISEASRTPVVQGSATVGYPFSTSRNRRHSPVCEASGDSRAIPSPDPTTNATPLSLARSIIDFVPLSRITKTSFQTDRCD